MNSKLPICRIFIYWLAAILLSFCSIAVAENQKHSDPMLLALHVDDTTTLCDEPVPVNDPRFLERFEKEMLVSLGSRHQVILWLKRTTRFFPYIEQVLADNDLPRDLKYLAIAESALRLHAGSRKGAMGVWQLMPQTARKYGLTVNANIDERRNFYLSTTAAVAYLKDLYNRFGAWSLSLAAYNMGEEGLEAEILEQGVSDYYRLYLPLETQRFVLRILAIKHIVEAPQRHGFSLSSTDYYPPRSFSSVRVHALADLPLRLIAVASGTDFKIIKDLNPELRGHYLVAGSRLVNIPAGSEKGFQDRLAQQIEADKKNHNRRIYVVKQGDSLSGIAQKFDVPLVALLIWNRIGINAVIHPGQRLVILPAGGADPAEIKPLTGDADG